VQKETSNMVEYSLFIDKAGGMCSG